MCYMLFALFLDNENIIGFVYKHEILKILNVESIIFFIVTINMET